MRDRFLNATITIVLVPLAALRGELAEDCGPPWSANAPGCARRFAGGLHDEADELKAWERGR